MSKSKSKKEVSQLEDGARHFVSLASGIMSVVREKAYPYAAIYRLTTEGGRATLGKIVDLAYADWQSEQPKSEAITDGAHPYCGGTSTRQAKFVATVVYTIPATGELRRRFPAHVDPAFNAITFKPIKVCENVRRKTREVEFEYVHLGYDVSSDNALAEIDKRGLRPTLPEELLAFDAKYPEEMMKFPIVALGSEASVRGNRYVASLWDNGCGRSLDLRWIDDGWYGVYRFLTVRKASS